MENEYGLAEIHKALIEALDELDEICRDNKIHYSLHGGTLLGARRNGKLIPWDDDLDISMTRDEYEKFKKACSGYKGDFYLNEIDTWLPRFATKDASKTMVFIDIFIWDYISENKIAQALKINLLRTFQGMLKRNIEYKNYNLKGKILVGATSTIGKLFPRKVKLKIFRYTEENVLLGKKLYIHRSNDAFKGVSYIFDKDYMNAYSSIKLEGKDYMVSARFEEFLSRNYGEDYMTPPPVIERKPIHGMQRDHFMHEDN